MIRAIRAYEAATGIKIGYKPAGGISKAKDALVYMALMKEELGRCLASPRPVPLRRVVAAGRHRTATRTPRHRRLFGKLAASDGMSKETSKMASKQDLKRLGIGSSPDRGGCV